MSFCEKVSVLTDSDVSSLLPKRSPLGHKGMFGRVALFCGSDVYPGAAILATEAALRSGVGYTLLFAPPKVGETVLVRTPECIFSPINDILSAPAMQNTLLSTANAIVFGCGVGQSEETEQLLYQLLDSPVKAPILIDADGINLLAKRPKEAQTICRNSSKNIIFTPHPLEFSRLFGGTPKEMNANRLQAVKEAAKAFSATVLLKGHDSLIATPKGEVWQNPTGSSALAKGGSGDVLAGLIGGLLAQGMTPEYATAVGAYLHGKAGDVLEKIYSARGVIPSDLPKVIAQILAAVEQNIS